MSKIQKQLITFILRWMANSIGIWVAISLLGNRTIGVTSIWTFIGAGIIFSLINSILKPIVTILALPAILVTLGLFTLVVNGFLVYVSLKLAPGLSIGFADSIIAGIILSLVNYIISSLLFLQHEEKE